MNRNVTLFAITMLLFGGMQTNLFGMDNSEEFKTKKQESETPLNFSTDQFEPLEEEKEEEEEEESFTPSNSFKNLSNSDFEEKHSKNSSNQRSNGEETPSWKNPLNWPKAAFRWTFGKNAWTKEPAIDMHGNKIPYDENTSTFTKLANLPSHFNNKHQKLSEVAAIVGIYGVIALPTYYILNRGNRAKLASLAQKNNQLSQQVTAIQQLLNKQTAGRAVTK